jgi:hypothetical protein
VVALQGAEPWTVELEIGTSELVDLGATAKNELTSEELPERSHELCAERR